jgi:Fic family protein
MSMLTLHYAGVLGKEETDWEGWTDFFLQCVRESAEDGVNAARRLLALLNRDRRAAANHKATTVTAIRLLDRLPEHPIVTLPRAMELLKTTKPTAGKAIDALCKAGILYETTGRQRDRIYAYNFYLKVLAEDSSEPA